MATEVKHGPDPQFERQGYGDFFCIVRGHYSTDSEYGLGGVVDYGFQSDRKEKQLNELLVLRTSFFNWFVVRYIELGGSREDAIAEIRRLCGD